MSKYLEIDPSTAQKLDDSAAREFLSMIKLRLPFDPEKNPHSALSRYYFRVEHALLNAPFIQVFYPDGKKGPLVHYPQGAALPKIPATARFEFGTFLLANFDNPQHPTKIKGNVKMSGLHIIAGGSVLDGAKIKAEKKRDFSFITGPCLIQNADVAGILPAGCLVVGDSLIESDQARLGTSEDGGHELIELEQTPKTLKITNPKDKIPPYSLFRYKDSKDVVVKDQHIISTTPENLLGGKVFTLDPNTGKFSIEGNLDIEKWARHTRQQISNVDIATNIAEYIEARRVEERTLGHQANSKMRHIDAQDPITPAGVVEREKTDEGTGLFPNLDAAGVKKVKPKGVWATIFGSGNTGKPGNSGNNQ